MNFGIASLLLQELQTEASPAKTSMVPDRYVALVVAIMFLMGLVVLWRSFRQAQRHRTQFRGLVYGRHGERDWKDRENIETSDNQSVRKIA